MSGVIFNFIGALLATALVFGGGLFQSGDVGTGLTLIGIGATGMGLLMALALTVSGDEALIGARVTGSTFTVDDLLIAIEDEEEDFPLYVLADRFRPADGFFIARVNGERAIVVELAEPVDDRTEVLRPVFSNREGM